jgi:hypothetical protein
MWRGGESRSGMNPGAVGSNPAADTISDQNRELQTRPRGSANAELAIGDLDALRQRPLPGGFESDGRSLRLSLPCAPA